MASQLQTERNLTWSLSDGTQEPPVPPPSQQHPKRHLEQIFAKLYQMVPARSGPLLAAAVPSES